MVVGSSPTVGSNMLCASFCNRKRRANLSYVIYARTGAQSTNGFLFVFETVGLAFVKKEQFMLNGYVIQHHDEQLAWPNG